VILGIDEMHFYNFKEGSMLNKDVIDLEAVKQETDKPATCAAIISIDHNNKYYRQTGEFGQRKHMILTGHRDGFVFLWKYDRFLEKLVKYPAKVTCIAQVQEEIAIATAKGIIFIWAANLASTLKKVLLQTLPFRIVSQNVVSMDANGKNLLLCTAAGDIIELTLRGKDQEVRSKKYPAISKLSGKTRSMCILNQTDRMIMLGSDSGIV